MRKTKTKLETRLNNDLELRNIDQINKKMAKILTEQTTEDAKHIIIKCNNEVRTEGPRLGDRTKPDLGSFVSFVRREACNKMAP